MARMKSISTIETELKYHKGFYISNICVAPELRGQGVGYKMLLHFLANQSEKEISLDVLKDNQNAINLYKRLGFTVEGEFEGFSIDDEKPQCYHMTRYKQGL